MSLGDSCQRYSAIGLILLVASVVGCGGPAGPVEKLVPVAGTLKVDGQPLEGVTLMFVAADNSPTRGGFGKTDAQGNFKVTHMTLNKPGIPAGAYSVVYSRFTKPDGSAIPDNVAPADVGAVQALPPLWSDLTKVGPHNRVEIPAAGNTALDLKIDTKAKR